MLPTLRKAKKEAQEADDSRLPDYQLNTMPLTGRTHLLLAVFDPVTLNITGTFCAK
jgi:hypothetical protein